MSYLAQTYEPNGELVSVSGPATASAPGGYTRRFSYDPAQQTGTDYGLPTLVQGDPVAQLDGSTRTAQQAFWYDAAGSLRCFSRGSGQWVLAYDALGRLTSAADPDDSSANGSSVCGKTTGRPQWNTQTTYAYYPSGRVSSSQTPAERAGGVASTFSYDADGNQTSQSHHFDCVQACTGTTTSKWYDGADRLVEVAMPQDGNDFYAFPWLTRYIYDISAGQNTTIGGQAVVAHGGLYKTQEWNTAPGATAPSWLDTMGSGTDALDRPTFKYRFQPGTNGHLVATASTYDADVARYGLLSSTTNGELETTSYAYDERGNLGSVTFSGALRPTPNRSYGYDANGRRTVEVSSVYGTKTSGYDATGALTSVSEAGGGTISSPATMTYDYYADGLRKDLNVSSSLLTANQLISNSYRADGALASTALNYAGTSYPFVASYTDAGRMLSRSDPFTGTIIPNPVAPVSAGSRYAPTTWSYDGGGQLIGHGMPYAYAYTGICHDAEGHMLGWHTNLPYYGDVSMQYNNSVRGENVGGALSTTTYGGISSSSVRLAHGSPIEYNFHTPSIDNLDPYNGIITAASGYTDHDPNGDGLTSANCRNPNTMAATYDRASRLVSHAVTVYDNTPVECGYNDSASSSSSYAYDAEDHTVELSGDATLCAGWGGDGKVVTFENNSCGQYTTTSSRDTLHYDGGHILFVTNAGPNAAALRFIQFGRLGRLGMVPNGSPQFSASDDDVAGINIASHSASKYSGITFGTKVWQLATGQRGTLFDGNGGGGGTYTNRVTVSIPASTPAPVVAGVSGVDTYAYDGPDGFTVAGKRFQGVRVMDSQSGHWTTPDAYAGNVDDPMS